MSENYNDDEIIETDDVEEKDKNEKFCFLCRRPESKAGPMIELPNNIHICTDCMQKSFNSMNQQFNEGKFNYSDLLNMPNVSMIDLSSFQNPVQQPKKAKKKKKEEKPVLDLIDKEIQMTKEKKAAYIGIKINSLTDKRNISISAALWDAIWNIPESTYLEQKTGIRSTSHLRIS